MILLYGSKAKKMASKILPYEECPSCKQKGNLELTLYRSYIHVYGIPVLNEGKQTEVECLSCECCIKPAYKPFFLKKSKYSEKIADEIREIKKYNKQSLWQLVWTSLLTIIFLIFLTVELIKNDAIKYLVSTDKENIALMENPQVGDIYKVGGKDGFFDKVRELGLDAAQGIFNR